jgi:hypothetical protein
MASMKIIRRAPASAETGKQTMRLWCAHSIRGLEIPGQPPGTVMSSAWLPPGMTTWIDARCGGAEKNHRRTA